MANLPERSKILAFYRRPLARLEKAIFIPKINPSWFQVLGIVFSLFFIKVAYSSPLNISILFLILIFDFFDGASARSQGLVSKKGWMIDVVFDRISEVILAIPFIDFIYGKIFLLLAILNIFLSFYSLKSGKHRVIAVRLFLLMFLIFKNFL